jgi:hypothetical protein
VRHHARVDAYSRALLREIFGHEQMQPHLLVRAISRPQIEERLAALRGKSGLDPECHSSICQTNAILAKINASPIMRCWAGDAANATSYEPHFDEAPAVARR